jgi:hypothetical protein
MVADCVGTEVVSLEIETVQEKDESVGVSVADRVIDIGVGVAVLLIDNDSVNDGSIWLNESVWVSEGVRTTVRVSSEYVVLSVGVGVRRRE